MGLLENLRERNQISIHTPDSERFRPYGKLLGSSFAELTAWMEANAEIPADGNIYIPSEPEMEQIGACREALAGFWGQLDYQVGYCNGRNSSLNGLEYHKSSELVVAVTDMALLLGKVQDIENNSYDAARAEAFLIPKGTAIELYATTLHLAPCKVREEGFKAVIILPRGTNLALEEQFSARGAEEDALLFAKNKWLLVHPSNDRMIGQHAHVGISGENTVINY